MAEISFTSHIKPVGFPLFSYTIKQIGKENAVVFPWTLKESKLGHDLFTTGIFDCTACLVTNGDNAFLMHLSPSMHANRDINKIENYIMKRMNLDNDKVHAILVGSKSIFEESTKLFQKVKSILDKHKVPTTVLRESHANGLADGIHLAYRKSADEVLISTFNYENGMLSKSSPKEILENTFKEVHLSEFDRL